MSQICRYSRVFYRNNVGGYTSAISGFCSYFFDGNKQILLDTLYNRPSETLKEMRTLARLTGNKP